MPLAGRRLNFLATFAAVLVSALLLASATALAGNAASKAPLAVAPPLTLDANPSALSPSALGDVDKFGKSTAEAPDVKIPDSIKLGNGTLRFDAGRTAVDPIPRVGLDATDPAVLPTPKDQDLPPGYFGLTLTTPTH